MSNCLTMITILFWDIIGLNLKIWLLNIYYRILKALYLSKQLKINPEIYQKPYFPKTFNFFDILEIAVSFDTASLTYINSLRYIILFIFYLCKKNFFHGS